MFRKHSVRNVPAPAGWYGARNHGRMSGAPSSKSTPATNIHICSRGPTQRIVQELVDEIGKQFKMLAVQ